MKDLTPKPMRTKQMLEYVREFTRRFGEAVDVALALKGGVRSTHRFAHEYGNQFWHMSYVDDSEEVTTPRKLDRDYPGAWWLPEPEEQYGL